MKKLLLLLLATSASIATMAQSTKWTTDPMHSFINFSIKHSGISFVDGSFKKFEGAIVSSKADLTDAQINFSVEVGSISTSVEMRDNHLKTDDFFNAEKYPKMTFVSTSLKKIPVKSPKLSTSSYILKGNLTIRDVTKPVTFMVTYGGTAKDQQGNTKAGFVATTSLNRLDYNIKYDPTGMGIAKDVKIVLNLQFAQSK